MGGRGALSSAIILAMSSFETWRVLSRITDDGLVVTRIGVLGLMEGVGLGGIIKVVWLSKDGNGVVGAGVALQDRDVSGKLKLTAISSTSFSPNSLSPDVFFNIVWITDVFLCTVWAVCVLVWDDGRPDCSCV